MGDKKTGAPKVGFSFGAVGRPTNRLQKFDDDDDDDGDVRSKDKIKRDLIKGFSNKKAISKEPVKSTTKTKPSYIIHPPKNPRKRGDPLPPPPTLENYKDTPVEGFGLAILRGLGYSDEQLKDLPEEPKRAKTMKPRKDHSITPEMAKREKELLESSKDDMDGEKSDNK